MTEAVARELFKLMAYKDEYEVARLHLDAVRAGAAAGRVRRRREGPFNLHPPLLRALGHASASSSSAAWVVPLFRALLRMRRLRGTRLDPFGRAEVRGSSAP